MADWAMGSQGTGRLELSTNWNTSTQVSLHYKLSCNISGGAYNYGPGPTWNGNMNGGHVGSGSWSYSSPGWRTLRELDVTFNKDANGNLSVSIYGYINGDNSPYVTSGSASWTHTPARIGIAPTISSVTADTIKPTSVRLRGEISSNGLGTSTTHTMYYRLLGSGTWISAGAQADVGGYNNWTVTGLKPGKTYQYYMKAVNNNGDTANSSTYTVKTKGIAGLLPILTRMT